MPAHILVIQVFLFGFTAWLGFYLIARNPARPLLRYTGLGLVSYGLAMAFDILVTATDGPALAVVMDWAHTLFLFLPVLFWVGTIIHLIPAELSWQPVLLRGWQWALVPATLLLYLLETLNSSRNGASSTSALFWVFTLLILGALIATLFFIRHIFHADRPKRPLSLILLVTLLFTLGVGMLFSPLEAFPRIVVLFAIGLDLELLGFAIAVLDSFDEGEAFLPDLLRSFHFSFFTVIFFAGLVVLTMVFSTGVTFPLLALLFATTLAAIVWQTFSDPIETILDRIALSNFARQRQSRAALRAAASAVPRVNTGVDFEAMADQEFARLTRRALSHYGDLPRLAASPLTHLPLIDIRLADRDSHGDTLARARELKALLTQSILQLKPHGQGDFGTSDEWRYYNALYFPYVVGLKPYSRRGVQNGLDAVSKQAIAWFQTTVPTRTLYNWQNAAARLVAQDLREQMTRLGVSIGEVEPRRDEEKKAHEETKFYPS